MQDQRKRLIASCVAEAVRKLGSDQIAQTLGMSVSDIEAIARGHDFNEARYGSVLASLGLDDRTFTSTAFMKRLTDIGSKMVTQRLGLKPEDPLLKRAFTRLDPRRPYSVEELERIITKELVANRRQQEQTRLFE